MQDTFILKLIQFILMCRICHLILEPKQPVRLLWSHGKISGKTHESQRISNSQLTSFLAGYPLSGFFYWVHSLIIFKMRSFQIQCKPSLRLINRNNYQCNHFPAIESILVSTLTENKFHSGDYEFKNLKTY